MLDYEIRKAIESLSDEEKRLNFWFMYECIAYRINLAQKAHRLQYIYFSYSPFWD